MHTSHFQQATLACYLLRAVSGTVICNLELYRQGLRKHQSHVMFEPGLGMLDGSTSRPRGHTSQLLVWENAPT